MLDSYNSTSYENKFSTMFSLNYLSHSCFITQTRKARTEEIFNELLKNFHIIDDEFVICLLSLYLNCYNKKINLRVVEYIKRSCEYLMLL